MDNKNLNFEVDHKVFCRAMGLSDNSIAGKAVNYVIHENGQKFSYFYDLVSVLHIKNPHLAAAKVKLVMSTISNNGCEK